ncbi:MAG: glycosyltransferase [Bacteroidota bacterium]|nr:glycosyltransferase [Bacteroidota bacterium]
MLLNKNILVFCLEDPFIKNTGYNMRVRQTINSLKDNNLFIITFDGRKCHEMKSSTTKAHMKKVSDSIFITELCSESFSIKKLFLGYGISAIQSLRSECNLKLVESQLREIKPDYIILEGFYFLGIVRSICPENNKIILNLHNYEIKRLISSVNLRSSFIKNYFTIAGSLEYAFMQWKERKSIWKYWIPTSEEKELLKNTFKVKDDAVSVIPNSSMDNTDKNVLKTVNKRDLRKLLFVGNYSYLPNEEAARILVRNIYPELIRFNKDITLFLAGPNPADWMKKIGIDKIIVTDYISDLSDLLKECGFFIAPLIHGGGTKFKVIQAMSYALPVVGTIEAFTGINTKQAIYIKPVALKEIPSVICSLSDNRELYSNLANECFCLSQEQFSFSKIKSLILKTLLEK